METDVLDDLIADRDSVSDATVKLVSTVSDWLFEPREMKRLTLSDFAAVRFDCEMVRLANVKYEMDSLLVGE